ncbi:hypothetical protein F4678DRAFT_467102 [Xylaria arbuscula]|nr:hypothetical protein F4678DRAFT_467102 [Xylaria arbuscula]
MDTLKKAANKMTGDESNAPGASSGGGQQEDYADKGKFPSSSLPFSFSFSLVINTSLSCAEYINKNYMGDQLSSDQREQITDAGRQGIEKATGQKVPDKFSQ